MCPRGIRSIDRARAAAYQMQITGKSGAVFELAGVEFDGFADGLA